MSKALQMLDARADTQVTAVSKLYRTPPWGKTDQSWFYNSCACIETNLPPFSLIEACLAIEADMKRERNERWGPRTLDIDILAMKKREGGLISLDDERLILPHPRMMLRAFVLIPLADIASDLQIEGQLISNAAHIAAQDTDAQGIEIADTNQDWWR
ncbi:2-amino-4-hydroxy-6-hydroxymethyldihydropteridine diphosphokinase [Brucellaceae bacterium C25G]